MRVLLMKMTLGLVVLYLGACFIATVSLRVPDRILADDHAAKGSVGWEIIREDSPASGLRLDHGFQPSQSPQPDLTAILSPEWNQHARDPQHSSYEPNLPSRRWRLAWQWNGSDASGGVPSDHVQTPRLVQPVTGGERVYVTYGEGIAALNEQTGAELWTASPGGALVATAAYDLETATVFVGSQNGNLYKLDPSTGDTIQAYAAGAEIFTPPLLAAGHVYVSAGELLVKLNKADISVPVWEHDAQAELQQMPAYSASRDILIVGTSSVTGQRLNVLAFFMTLWRPCSRNDGRSCGIRWG